MSGATTTAETGEPEVLIGADERLRTAGVRAGMTLVELIIGMSVTAIIISAMVGLFISQSRLSDQQESQRSARATSRAATNVLFSELRMIESAGGVESVSANAVTMHVPYAIGVVCSSSSSGMTVSLLPVDDVTLSQPGYSGYAWRGGGGDYTYVDGSQEAPEPESDAACTSALITPISSDLVVRLTPGVASGAAAGTPVLLLRRVRYEFAPSAEVDGDTALVRTIVDADDDEAVLAGPFDGDSRFRFFVDGTTDAQDSPPADLGDIRGLEVEFAGRGDRPAGPGGDPARSPLTIAVFFNNVSP